jgi:hypothetical protein
MSGDGQDPPRRGRWRWLSGRRRCWATSRKIRRRRRSVRCRSTSRSTGRWWCRGLVGVLAGGGDWSGTGRVPVRTGGDGRVVRGLSRTGRSNGGRWRRWRNGRQRYQASQTSGGLLEYWSSSTMVMSGLVGVLVGGDVKTGRGLVGATVGAWVARLRPIQGHSPCWPSDWGWQGSPVCQLQKHQVWYFPSFLSCKASTKQKSPQWYQYWNNLKLIHISWFISRDSDFVIRDPEVTLLSSLFLKNTSVDLYLIN